MLAISQKNFNLFWWISPRFVNNLVEKKQKKLKQNTFIKNTNKNNKSLSHNLFTGTPKCDFLYLLLFWNDLKEKVENNHTIKSAF